MRRFSAYFTNRIELSLRKMWDRWRESWKYLNFLLFAIATFLLVIYQFSSATGQVEAKSQLPSPQIHVLPPALAAWQDRQEVSDYFDLVKSTPLGYLIWSSFPVKVYIERFDNPDDGSASSIRSQQWFKSVTEAIGEWNDYLPLTQVDKPELADILIKRSPPPIEAKINPTTGLFEIPRARTAQTSYQFYLRSELGKKIVSQRMTVEISPDRGDRVIKAAARHELGHALGIWGHSPNQNDALYFSATSDPPTISSRDINTLKKIYQQPTSLGWEISNK
jgi:predicted Zn-dependent protease